MKYLPLVVATFFSYSAQAVVLPYSFMMETMVKTREKVRSVSATYTVTAYLEQRASSVKFKEVINFNADLDEFVSQAFDETGKLLYAEKKSLGEDSCALATLLEFEKNEARIQKSLNRLGFKIEQPHLDRIQNQVAWVYGDKIQLWIKKDEFTPLRWMHPNSRFEKGSPIDVMFESFRISHEIKAPSSITVSSKNQTLLKAELQTITVNDKKFHEPAVGPSGLTPDGENANPVLKELIERYYTHLR